MFAAELGPPYRRAYALMGDCTNVAARLTARRPFGHIYASRDVPERLRTNFHLTALAPLELKGKRRPLRGLGRRSGDRRHAAHKWRTGARR